MVKPKHRCPICDKLIAKSKCRRFQFRFVTKKGNFFRESSSLICENPDCKSKWNWDMWCKYVKHMKPCKHEYEGEEANHKVFYCKARPNLGPIDASCTVIGCEYMDRS